MQLNVKLTYPYDPNFKYETILERINLDEERIHDLQIGKGFIISEPQSIKKDIKDYNGIFSTRFGQTLQDVNPFANKHSCECKHLQGRIYDGIECPICHTKVRYVGEEMDFFGWIVLEDPYYLIHPNMYKTIEFIIGQRYLNNILKYDIPLDENGHIIPDAPKPKGEPYYGIGMMDFKERFDEIMKYYIGQNQGKAMYYEDVLKYRDIIFIQSVPVYTTHLRPFRVDGTSFYFEKANGLYNDMAKKASLINRRTMMMTKKAQKPKNELLWEMQICFNDLEKEVEESLAKKKGQIRSLFGGRYNMTSRAVIGSDPSLRSYQVRLPYKACVEMFQQVIINILHRSYGMSYDAAWKIWYKAKIQKDDRVYNIIKGLIHDSKEGIPVFINRPPTIQYGSTLFMRVVGINDNYTMSVPLEILPLLAGDFDGDALSILWIINKSVEAAAEEVFSPRYAMYISRNDGMFNNDINHQKDIIIAACGLIGLARKYYTDDELAIIRKAQLMTEDIVPVGDTSIDRIPAATASIAKINYINRAQAVDPYVQEFNKFIKACKHYDEMYDLVFNE